MNTGNFSYDGNHKNAVSVALYPPAWFKGQIFKELAPTGDMIRGKHDKSMSNGEYEKKYFDLLKKRNITPKKIVEELGENAVLLCWCKKGAFCHRRLLARWFEEELNMHIPEL